MAILISCILVSVDCSDATDDGATHVNIDIMYKINLFKKLSMFPVAERLYLGAAQKFFSCRTRRSLLAIAVTCLLSSTVFSVRIFDFCI